VAIMNDKYKTCHELHRFLSRILPENVLENVRAFYGDVCNVCNIIGLDDELWWCSSCDVTCHYDCEDPVHHSYHDGSLTDCGYCMSRYQTGGCFRWHDDKYCKECADEIEWSDDDDE
jgi:hypothetical protein